MAGGNTKDKIDRQLLHEFLWDNRGRGDFMVYSVTELSEKLGITIYSMSRILGQMRDVGRIEKVGRKYRIFDPSVFAWNSKR